MPAASTPLSFLIIAVIRACKSRCRKRFAVEGRFRKALAEFAKQMRGAVTNHQFSHGDLSEIPDALTKVPQLTTRHALTARNPHCDDRRTLSFGASAELCI